MKNSVFNQIRQLLIQIKL